MSAASFNTGGYYMLNRFMLFMLLFLVCIVSLAVGESPVFILTEARVK